MKIPEPVLIGYLPKRTGGKCEWFGDAPVAEVCSISDCISSRPSDWIDAWKHNAWGFYDSEEVAWEIVPDESMLYDVYAYKLFPFKFDGGGGVAIFVEPTATAPLVEYEFLGYDPVSRWDDMIEFQHSPLSCNKGFEQYPVNRYCLLGDLETSWRITAEIAEAAKVKGFWEPGPYYLCEVYRKRQTTA